MYLPSAIAAKGCIISHDIVHPVHLMLIVWLQVKCRSAASAYGRAHSQSAASRNIAAEGHLILHNIAYLVRQLMFTYPAAGQMRASGRLL